MVTEVGTAVVRRALAEIEAVNRTWFEWTFEGENKIKTLVVEVNFDTDPNSGSFDASALQQIEQVVRGALILNTTMIVTYLRVIPRLER